MAPLIESPADLAASVRAFMDAPEYWRDAVGSHPKYFVHLQTKNGSAFGLSKFCAFRDISLEDYVVTHRHTRGGGQTQKHIRKVCGTDWTPLHKVPRKLRAAFLRWFTPISQGSLGTKDVYLLTVEDSTTARPNKPKRRVSPLDLAKRLAAQNKIGAIGEEIALAYERTRLLKSGARGNDFDVVQVSLQNVAAGFDIRSRFKKDIRHIEVKASTSNDGLIYVSLNEIETLHKLGASSYLYVVHVTNVSKREGAVVRILRDPFKKGHSTTWLAPCLFVGQPPASTSQSVG